MKIFAAAASAVAMLATGCSSVDLTPMSGREIAAKQIVWKTETFKAGDTVTLTARAGTFKPADTRHANEIDAGPGQSGLLLGGMKRGTGMVNGVEEAIQLALVRFPAQSWRDNTTGQQVELAEFEATVHADYLDVAK